MKGKWPYLSLMVCLVGFGYLFSLNPNQVSFRLHFGPPVQTNLALVVFLAFLTGFAVAFVSGLGQELFHSLRFWRHQRRERRGAAGRQFLQLGRGFLVAGHPRAALKALRKARRRLPDDAAVGLELAKAELTLRQPAAVETRLKALLEDDPNSTEAMALLLDLQRRGRDVEGEKATLSRWLETDPDHRPSLEALRELYRRGNQWPEAIRVQERLLARAEGREARARQRRVLSGLQILGSRLMPASARQVELRKVVEGDGTFAAGYGALGEVLATEGKEDEACRIWLKGFRACGQAGLLLKVEELRLRQGRGEELLRLYRKFEKRDAFVDLLQARLLIELNRSDEALDLLEQTEHKNDKGAFVEWLKGEALLRLRSFERAARAFRRSGGALEETIPVPFFCVFCGSRALSWEPSCPRCHAVDTLQLNVGMAAPPLPARS